MYSAVDTEAQGYLAVHSCRPDFKIIHEGLQRYAVSELDYQLNQTNPDRILEEKGQTTTTLAELYKISVAELREVQ